MNGVEEKSGAGRHHALSHEINREECLDLLKGHAYVGRVGFIVDGRPMVLPVNYLSDGTDVLFCTAVGSLLSGLREGDPAAFEIDSSSALYSSGWSVLVQGKAWGVADQAQVDVLRRGPLQSWAQPVSELWIRISIDQISGRRIPEN